MTEFLQPLRSLFEYVDQLPTSIAIRESQYFSPYTTLFRSKRYKAHAGIRFAGLSR